MFLFHIYKSFIQYTGINIYDLDGVADSIDQDLTAQNKQSDFISTTSYPL